jgi:hypothetical protein
MSRDRHKDAQDRATNRLEGRPKALRRELTDLEAELEKARRRRDRAQARVEALEAIAEQLTTALVAAEAARERRREAQQAIETSADEPASLAPGTDEGALSEEQTTPRKTRRAKPAKGPKASKAALAPADGSEPAGADPGSNAPSTAPDAMVRAKGRSRVEPVAAG